MNIPMNRKPPIRLGELASSMGRNVRKPHRLEKSLQTARPGIGRDLPTNSLAQPVRSSAGSSTQANRPVRPAASSHPSAAARPSAPSHPSAAGRPSAAARSSAPPSPSAPTRPATPPRPKNLAGTRLQKGQKVSLAENGRSFSQLEVSLGWNAKNPACDLDASAFLLAGNNKVVGDEWFVFYGQEQSPDGSVVHRGDSAGGVGETLAVDLCRMYAPEKKIVFIITINEALRQGLNFGMVSDAYIQLRSPAAGKGILHFELEEYYSNVTSMMVGELYERNGEWKFHAIGNGVARDLAGLCELYGVNVSG